MISLTVAHICLMLFLVLMCVIRIAEIHKHTSEIEAWGYIMLSIGGVWIVCGLYDYGKWVFIYDEVINMDFAIVLFLTGINFLLYCYADPLRTIKRGNQCHQRRYTDPTTE